MKWNKIISLIKVFLNSFYYHSKIFEAKRGKLNTKSKFFWMIVTIIFAIGLISYKIIHFIGSTGQPQIFLYLYFIFLAILLIFEIILISTNILFFSKDLEYVLFMPINSLELLFAKYGVFLIITYVSEFTIGFIPLIIYGLLNFSFSYFVYMPIVLLIFPILLVTIISFITVILMKFVKYIKNQDTYQKIVTIVLILLVIGFENIVINHFSKNVERQQKIANEQTEYKTEDILETYSQIGKAFVIVNPATEILSNTGNIKVVFKNIALLILYNGISFLVFLQVGKRVYLKNLLLGMNKTIKIKRNKNIILKKKLKKKSKRMVYILKDIKQLYRVPTFFMQMVFPVIIILISAIMIGNFIIPIIDEAIQSSENIQNTLRQLTFNTEMVCIVLGILQVLFSMSDLSLTAISREGKNAVFIKYIPIDLYKQFLYKNILQVGLNTIVSIVVLGILYFLISKISVLQILLLFITSIFISLINSFLMLIVDLRRPNLNWSSEYVLIKKNENKIFQYVFMIIMILIFLYLSNILQEMNIHIAIVIQMMLFAIIFMIMNILVKKKINKLFNKII